MERYIDTQNQEYEMVNDAYGGQFGSESAGGGFGNIFGIEGAYDDDYEGQDFITVRSGSGVNIRQTGSMFKDGNRYYPNQCMQPMEFAGYAKAFDMTNDVSQTLQTGGGSCDGMRSGEVCSLYCGAETNDGYSGLES